MSACPTSPAAGWNPPNPGPKQLGSAENAESPPLADMVEDRDGHPSACSPHLLPVLPLWRQVPVFGEVQLVEIVWERVGQLSLELLQGV